MMIDVGAPILPAQGAAGISLGTPIDPILADLSVRFRREDLGAGLGCYRSGSVDVWTEGGVVVQVGVHGGYAGKLSQQVGVGTPLAELRARLGPTALDEEDNVVVRGLSGVCFEYDVDAADSPITHIFVFPAG